MEATTRNQVIIAAINAAGTPQVDQFEGESPEAFAARSAAAAAAYQQRIASNATMFAAMLDEKSAISRLVDAVDRSKVFTTTVIGITKEKSSTRGKVTLKGAPSKFHEDGVEEARTDRTDNSDGVGLEMAKKLRSLIGHKVMIWIELEEINGGAGKVRVVRHVEDMGVDTRYGLDESGALVEVAPAA